VDRVQTLLRSDRRLGVRVIAEELNMKREAVRQIVKDDLGMLLCTQGKEMSVIPETRTSHAPFTANHMDSLSLCLPLLRLIRVLTAQ